MTDISWNDIHPGAAAALHLIMNGGGPSLPARHGGAALKELRALPQWVCWRYEQRGDKLTKPPVNPHTGRGASHSNPTHWGSYEQACKRAGRDKLPGIGFVLTADDGLTGIDLDECRDPDTGAIE